MSQDALYINGELLRLARETRGWVIGDMATRACLSVKQIRQLEEGGTSAFYSPAVKMTSAKKLAGILELSTEQVFTRSGAVEAEAGSSHAAESSLAHTDDQPTVAEVVTHTQPAVVIETPQPLGMPAGTAVTDEPKAKTSVWAIAALFVVAIAVAAYMQQQEEPATEPPPPLQVLPAEADAAASAPEPAASSASDASDHAATPVASTPVVSASTPLPVTSTAIAPPPAAAALKPAASAASKPL